MRWKPASVSPSIHEAVVARHYALDSTTRAQLPDTTIDAMTDAMREARLAAEKASRIAEAAMNNEMQTLPARHRQVRSETWKVAEPALRRIDAAIRAAKAARADIDARTAPQRPADAVAALLAGEIRSRLAGMTPEARAKVVALSLSAPDDVTIGAVLGGPPMLSGMSDAEVAVLRTSWRQNRFPAELDRASRLERATEDLVRGGGLVIAHLSKLSSTAIVASAENSERAVAEAIAS